jgi:hypothetical protein
MGNTITTTASKQPTHPGSINYPIDLSPAVKRAYQNRSLGNLLRMGHCAPTVMQTVLDSAHTEQEWLVKLAAGMPGGIGNTGFECGGITSPLVLMGLRYGLGHIVQGLPLIFYKGSDLFDRFLNCHKTLMCREIRGKSRLPLRCIPVIRHSPELLVEATANDNTSNIPEEKRKAYCRLYVHLAEKGFHCSHAVFQNLVDTIPVSQELLDASSGFLGGTLFQGRTCSAFTAGVMAVGLKFGEIENSPLRVIRMIAMMAFGGNAFSDSINKFNKPMNTGYRISKWFRKEFGSTQCQEITQCDFSSPEGVGKYIESGCVTRCRVIAEKVAEQVQDILNSYKVNETRAG